MVRFKKLFYKNVQCKIHIVQKGEYKVLPNRMEQHTFDILKIVQPFIFLPYKIKMIVLLILTLGDYLDLEG